MNYLKMCLKNIPEYPIYLNDNIAFGNISFEYIGEQPSVTGYVKIILIKCNKGYGFVQQGNKCYQPKYFRLCKNGKGKWNIMFEDSYDGNYISSNEINNFFNYNAFINELDRESDKILKT